ncbi:S9 family peptidase [Pararhodonellum marinum]|uniref:S9 family peptidase n=1 Tax=Pararhodonellum marinum TaxID=2755358 RepID=UPI00188E8EF6|nr:prolyl oligopeptidase family serine peptidase [Pararhodonellum marinum]
MMNRYPFLFAFCFLWFSVQVYAQQKRPLTHADYDAWETVDSEKITKNGQWVGFEIKPQEGDGRFEASAHGDPGKRYLVPRGEAFQFTDDGQWVLGKIIPEKDSVKLLKLKKTKSEEMPKDSLFILDLSSGSIEKLARVKSFKIPAKNQSWVAVHFEKEKETKEAKKDSTETNEKAEDKRKSTEGTTLLLRDFQGNQSFELSRVDQYGFSENGKYLFYRQATEDTLKNAALQVFDLSKGSAMLVDEGKADYHNMVFSKDEAFLAYLTTEDSAKSKKPYYDLYLYDLKKQSTSKLADKDHPNILKEGMVSKNGDLYFREDGQYLFFGTAPDYQTFAYEEDTTILDEDRVKLDIWGWQDDEIQPMQLSRKEQELKRTYLALYDLQAGAIRQLEDRQLMDINVDRKATHGFALGTDDAAQRRKYSWDIQIGRDIYLVNLKTGQKTKIVGSAYGYPSLSPEGKYITWYSQSDSTWLGYDIEKKANLNLAKGISEALYQELHDSPSMPGGYGSAGWTEGDKAFLIYDRYDIWKIDPTGKTTPQNITLGEGRKQKITFRRQVLDKEERGIKAKEPLILNAFHETNKKSGYYSGDLTGQKPPSPLLFSDHRYYGLTKAENSDAITVRRSTYQEYPDVFAGNLNMTALERLSFANPQQSEVNWGSVELVEYLANDGTPLQGLLFKPEDFDAEKRYPLMVYFYERNSDGLHGYRAPVPSASIINIPFFVSNDYVVFVPDIKYDLGLPGPSAYNCIIPGVQSVITKGFIDTENMAIQGQSWGGYQVAYLITRTNMFKAAGAGAPVVNMTSAYGGIRWGTGMSRMFQYEQTQSRIGGTLWEKPLYYLENSPLFYMDRVQTPVLIMHNDADGAVPWYQGIEMFMALKRLNQPAWLLQYNDEDHNLRQRKNRKDLSIRLSQFFDHYLKGAPAPLWMTEGLPAVEKGRTLKYELEGE